MKRDAMSSILIAVVLLALGVIAEAQARTAADPSADVAGVDPGHKSPGSRRRSSRARSAVRGTDGRFHIAYELVLTDTTQFAVDVKRVEVRDAKTHRVLLSLAGPALSSRMNSVGGAPAGVTPDARHGATLLAPSGSAVVWLDVRVRRKADLPDVLRASRCELHPPPTGRGNQYSFQAGRSRLAADPKPVELGPPVRGGIWVAAEGCCDDDTHHRRGLLVVNGNEVVPQRFAIDWMKLDRSHRAWVGDPARLSSYRSYGQPLIAAADGKVVVARDGRPNQPPPNNPTPPSVAGLPGNHVILRIGPGIYVLYAHMVPGSVRVHVGERVRRGQVLGRLGNSGNSATPHLHFQVQITRSFLSDGLPFVFRPLPTPGPDHRAGSGTGTSACGPTEAALRPRPRPGTRRREMPLDHDVVRFPDARSFNGVSVATAQKVALSCPVWWTARVGFTRNHPQGK